MRPVYILASCNWWDDHTFSEVLELVIILFFPIPDGVMMAPNVPNVPKSDVDLHDALEGSSPYTCTQFTDDVKFVLHFVLLQSLIRYGLTAAPHPCAWGCLFWQARQTLVYVPIVQKCLPPLVRHFKWASWFRGTIPLVSDHQLAISELPHII